MVQYKHLFTKYKQLIPLIILSCVCISTFFASFGRAVEMNGERYEFEFTVKHYGAFFAIGLNWVCFFLFRHLFKYVLILTLFLGIMNFINFTLTERTWSVGVGNLLLSFQPVSFFISVLVYMFNFERVNKTMYELMGPTSVQDDMSLKRRQHAQFDKFRDRFSKYSDDELHDILVENKLVPEALQVVREVLTERGKLGI